MSSRLTIFLVRYLPYLLLLLATAIIGLRYYYRMGKPFRLLTILVCIIFVCEATAKVLAYTTRNSNPTYHISIPLQILLYTMIYKALIKPGKKLSLVMNVCCLLGICFSIVNTVWLQPIEKIPSQAICIQALLVILYALWMFYDLLQQPPALPLYLQPGFWFSTGNLIFYCTTFFILSLFIPFKTALEEAPKWEYTVIYLCNWIMYALYLAALIVEQKRLRHETD